MRGIPALLLLLGLLAAPARAGGAPTEAEPWIGVATVPIDDPLSRDAARVDAYTGIGPAFVEVGPVEWGRVEPAPPGTGGRPGYDWGDLDATVSAWQSGAFGISILLSPRSGWASVPFERTDWAASVRKTLSAAEATVLLRERTAATPPRTEGWASWERFVQDAVERYDGDGILDMPGLFHPVRCWRVLDRPYDSTVWAGGVEEYLRLLHHVDLGAHRAWEDVQIVHGGLVDPATLPREGPLAALEAERAGALLSRSLETSRLFGAAVIDGPLAPAESGPQRWRRVHASAPALAEARAEGLRRVFLTDAVVARNETGGWTRTPQWYAVRQWNELSPPDATAVVGPLGERGKVAWLTAPRGLKAEAVGVLWFPTPASAPADLTAVRVAHGRYEFVGAADSHASPPRQVIDAPEGIVLVPLGSTPSYLVPLRAEDR